MKKTRILETAVILISLAGCHDDKSKSTDRPVDPSSTGQVVPPMPVLALGLNGDLAAGSITWTLPDFLKEKFQDLNKANIEAALDIDLTRSTDKKATRVNTGFTVKPCDPAVETEVFVSSVAKPAAENVPPSHKLDVYEVSSWTSESKSFKGRLFLSRSYKSQGETGVYRMDALVTNTASSECVLWNLVFTPDAGATTEFIEGSDQFKALMTSLSTTWEDMGADFDG